MSYKVISPFTDLQDGNHAYSVGDIFPREGVAMISEKRIAELASADNKQGRPLISNGETPKVEVAEEKPVVDAAPVDKKPQADMTAEDVKAMKYFTLKSVAEKHGIEVDGKKADELRAELIEKLGLE